MALFQSFGAPEVLLFLLLFFPVLIAVVAVLTALYFRKRRGPMPPVPPSRDGVNMPSGPISRPYGQAHLLPEDSLPCAKCGTSNPVGTVFCRKCGVKL